MSTNENDNLKHSEEIQDIIGRPPQWLVQWGILVLFLILVSIVVLSKLINYPDVVTAEIKIRSYRLPVMIAPDSSGRLLKLFVKNKQIIRKGQQLAIIQYNHRPTILVAPCSGSVNFCGIIHEGQFYLTHQNIFYLSTGEKDNFFGEMAVLQNNLTKIKEGQEVIIMIKNYPYRDYGTLHGIVRYVASRDYNSNDYVAEVAFTNQRITDRSKVLELKSGMSGDAEVVIRNKTLFDKILNTVSGKFSH